MLTRNPTAPADHTDPVPTLLAHLDTGNDVIRIGAIKALVAQAPGDARARVALLAALRDEDPDVRTDAMDALAAFALPEDGNVIRESLQGDPVREVKLAAIELLTTLKDRGSIPLFRALAKDRCDDQVAWEDEAGLWDEWLEIQTAVIHALGRLNAEEALQDLLAARDDEFGQNLDVPAFKALARMGSEGLVWLLSVAQTEQGLARKRALEALAGVDDTALQDHMDYLLGDDAADVRRLVLPVLDAQDDRAAFLALKDPDASLRAQALALFAPKRAELAKMALSDTAPQVQAVALDHLQMPLDADLSEALGANMQAWLSTDDGPLAVATARNWMRLAPDAAHAPLLDLIRDEPRPLEARIAAVDALASQQDKAATERLVSLLSNPAQQVRLVALTNLVARANTGDEVAIEALAHAAEGVLLAPEAAVVERDAEEGIDATADHDDTDGVPRLRVTDDGDVVAADKGATAGSTLEAIQLARVPGAGTKKDRAKQKRRAIEGPDAVAQDLARVALGLLGQVRSERISAAILAQASGAEDAMRIAAFRALSMQSQDTLRSDPARERIALGLMDRAAAVRTMAADMASTDPALRDGVAALKADKDVMVRTIAMRTLDDPDSLLEALSDAGTPVRDAALEQLCLKKSNTLTTQAFHRLVEAGRIDTLQGGVRRDPQCLELAVIHLDTPDIAKRDLHVVLSALANPV